MDTHEVIPKKMNSKRGPKAFELLGKGVRKPRKTAHLHPDRKVLALHKGRGNMSSDGEARHGNDSNADDTARRITMLALRNVFG